jgi:hypothetical protein
MSKIFMNDRPNALMWDAKFVSYLFSRSPALFEDYVVNLMYNPRGVNVLGRPGLGASQAEKSPRLNWATPL